MIKVMRLLYAAGLIASIVLWIINGSYYQDLFVLFATLSTSVLLMELWNKPDDADRKRVCIIIYIIASAIMIIVFSIIATSGESVITKVVKDNGIDFSSALIAPVVLVTNVLSFIAINKLISYKWERYLLQMFLSILIGVIGIFILLIALFGYFTSDSEPSGSEYDAEIYDNGNTIYLKKISTNTYKDDYGNYYKTYDGENFTRE